MVDAPWTPSVDGLVVACRREAAAFILRGSSKPKRYNIPQRQLEKPVLEILIRLVVAAGVTKIMKHGILCPAEEQGTCIIELVGIGYRYEV